MKSNSYKNALYYYYYNFMEEEQFPLNSKKKESFFLKFPEFKIMEKCLEDSSVVKGIFDLTMINLIEQMPKNAIFYADKLKTLTNNNPTILYLLGNKAKKNQFFRKKMQTNKF